MVKKSSSKENAGSISNEKIVSAYPVKKKSLSIGKKSVLQGDYPKVLDLNLCKFKHKGVICITDSDTVESIIIPSKQYEHVIIENLPNLTDVYVEDDGPTWLEFRRLPELSSVIVRGGTRWLSLEDTKKLRILDVSGCIRLSQLSIHNAPAIEVINIQHCRFLSQIDGLSVEQSSKIGVSSQLEATRKSSRKDSKLYEDMTYADIEVILSNISHAASLLAKIANESDGVSEEPSTNTNLYNYEYCVLSPGEVVNTGGTGESYSYAFRVFQDEVKKGKITTCIIDEYGIHEPEDSIGAALQWAISNLTLPSETTPTVPQLIAYFNLVLSTSGIEPDKWAQINETSLMMELAENPLIPETVLAAFSTSPESSIRLTIAENPSASEELKSNVLHGLRYHPDFAVRIRVARNAATTQEDLEVLSLDENSAVRLATLKNPSSSEALRKRVLHGLVNDNDPTVRFEVASNSETEHSDLVLLSRDSDVTVICAVVENSKASKELCVSILDDLSGNVDPNIRLAVAKHEYTSEKAFMSLVESADDRILVAIAENPSASNQLREALLKQLCNSKDLRILYSVARNPLTTPDTLDLLIKTGNKIINLNVIEHSRITSSTLEAFADSDDEDICYRLASHPLTPSKMLVSLAKKTYSNEFIHLNIASNPSVSSDVCKVLAKGKRPEVRIALAKNIATDPLVLESMSNNRDVHVRAAIARYAVTSAKAMEKLSIDKRPEVRFSLARNIAVDPLILESMTDDIDSNVRQAIARNDVTPLKALEKLSIDEDVYVRKDVASHKTTTPNLFEILVLDMDYQVRWAVASNKNCPRNLVLALMSDENEYVRKAAANNITLE